MLDYFNELEEKVKVTRIKPTTKYVNYHSMPFMPYDTKAKTFVPDFEKCLIAEMAKQGEPCGKIRG